MSETGLTAKQEDACSGIALLYIGPSGNSDEYVERLHTAMESGDVDEAESVSADMLLMLLLMELPEESFWTAREIWHKAFGTKATRAGSEPTR